MTGRVASVRAAAPRMLPLCMLLLPLLVLLGSGLAAAAEPTATPLPLIGGDPRSEGAGPGIVGSPLMILVAVLGVGIVTVLVTIVVARLAQRR